MVGNDNLDHSNEQERIIIPFGMAYRQQEEYLPLELKIKSYKKRVGQWIRFYKKEGSLNLVLSGKLESVEGTNAVLHPHIGRKGGSEQLSLLYEESLVDLMDVYASEFTNEGDLIDLCEKANASELEKKLREKERGLEQ